MHNQAYYKFVPQNKWQEIWWDAPWFAFGLFSVNGVPGLYWLHQRLLFLLRVTVIKSTQMEQEACMELTGSVHNVLCIILFM
jgi:hypothetical protein